jgi:hypothetical protein
MITHIPLEMNTLDAEIATLEAKIEGYEAQYATALSEDKRLLLEVIIAARQKLNRLLAERNTASTLGMRFCVCMPCLIHLFHIIRVLWMIVHVWFTYCSNSGYCCPVAGIIW